MMGINLSIILFVIKYDIDWLIISLKMIMVSKVDRFCWQLPSGFINFPPTFCDLFRVTRNQRCIFIVKCRAVGSIVDTI